ncbi:hypothetical protein D3C73_1205480 [compost metagenome]
MRKASDNTFNSLELMFLFAKFNDIMTLMFNEVNERFGTADFFKICTQQRILFSVRQLKVSYGEASTRSEVNKIN